MDNGHGTLHDGVPGIPGVYVSPETVEKIKTKICTGCIVVACCSIECMKFSVEYNEVVKKVWNDIKALDGR